eukprot:636381-Amphidinium_carterae.1
MAGRKRRFVHGMLWLLSHQTAKSAMLIATDDSLPLIRLLLLSFSAFFGAFSDCVHGQCNPKRRTKNLPQEGSKHEQKRTSGDQ